MQPRGDQPTFGSLLRRYRTSAALTQEQLAERAGLSRRGIADLERGARQAPYAHTLDQLRNALALSDVDDALLLSAARTARSIARELSLDISQTIDAAVPPGVRRLAVHQGQNNLPVQPTSFVGRESERSQVATLVQSAPLLTLLGPGGVGKTRLALEVAGETNAFWPDGVWLIELAPLIDPNLVSRTVAVVLGVYQPPDVDPMTSITAWLRSRRMLLVLDNCEHLLVPCARLAAELLRKCPDVHLLATSRETLGIAGETVWRVEPLRIPEADAFESVVDCDAVRLFSDRAAAASPGFALTQDNARVVAQVCRQIDGLPLALELAAARLRALSVEELAARLTRRYELLTGGSRDALPRHRTLRALIDWSYDLLTDDERALFEHLAVFSGGWTLDAAEAICTVAHGSTLDVLGQLIDKSLVETELQPNGRIRYGMLETIREYAAERLRTRDSASEVQRRHAFYFTEVIPTTWGWFWWGDDTQNRLRMIEADYANFRAAARWHQDHLEVNGAQRLAGLLTYFWTLLGRVEEGRVWIKEALALSSSGAVAGYECGRFEAVVGFSYLEMVGGDRRAAMAGIETALQATGGNGDPPIRALALMQAGRLSWMVGHNFALARTYMDEAVALAETVGPESLQAFVFGNMAGMLYEAGENDVAERLLERSMRLGPDLEQYIGHSRTLLARVRFDQGNFTAAATLLEEVLEGAFAHRSVHREMFLLTFLSWARLAQSDIAGATAAATRALKVVRDHLGSTLLPGHLGGPLEAFAQIAVATDQPARAVRLVSAAAALREADAIRLSPTEATVIEAWMAHARKLLGPRAFAAECDAGRALSVEVAIAEGLAVTAPLDKRPQDHGLTRREHEVMLLAARGLSNRDIGQQLVISEGTARIHVERVLGKLSLHSRAQLAAWAVQNGYTSANICPTPDGAPEP